MVVVALSPHAWKSSLLAALIFYGLCAAIVALFVLAR